MRTSGLRRQDRLSPVAVRQHQTKLRRHRMRGFTLATSARLALASALLLLFFLPAGFSRALTSDTAAAPRVRSVEGLLHGFLALRNLEGELLAEGEITQIVHGDRIAVDLVFH